MVKTLEIHLCFYIKCAVSAILCTAKPTSLFQDRCHLLHGHTTCISATNADSILIDRIALPYTVYIMVYSKFSSRPPRTGL